MKPKSVVKKQAKKPLKKLEKVVKLKKKDHISYSQIQNGRCLHRYKTINLQGKIDVFNDAMKEGAFVHNVIYEYTKKCVEAGHESDFETMNQIFEEKFSNYHIDESKYIDIRSNMMNFAEKGVNFETILDYEKEFNVKFDDVCITGVIDRVNCYKNSNNESVIEIVDYKNMDGIYTSEEVEQDLQLRIYRYIACEHLYSGYDVVRVGIYNTKYNFPRWGSFVKISDLKKREFYDIETFLKRQWERLINTADDMYVPERGSACWEYGQCEVLRRGLCSAYKDKDVGSIENKVRQLRKIDADRNELIVSVKEYFKGSKNIEVDGIEVGFKTAMSKKYNAVNFINKSVELGIPVGSLTIGITDARKAFKEKTRFEDVSPNYEEMFKDLELVTGSNKFVY